MADGQRLAKAYVEIGADLAQVDQGMNKLPDKVSRKILEVQRKTQAQLARNQLELKVAVAKGDFREIDRLNAAQERLRGTMEKVNRAAMNQAALMRGMPIGVNAGAITQAGASGGRSGGGAFGGAGMGLLMISQFVDDAQYGFKSLVNQIPQVGMALGSAFGMGTEAAMKFGGAVGIAGVAVNLLINHWDELMDLLSLGKVLTEAEQMERLANATKLTADEQERLNRFKRAQAAGQELSDKQASGVEKTTNEVKQAIADLGDERSTGRSKLIDGLVQSRRAAGFGAKMDDEEQRQLDIIRRDFGGTKYGQQLEEKLRAKIQDRLDAEDNRRAADTVDKATFDSLRRQGLINEIRANPGAFPAGAAEALNVTPAKNTKDQAREDAEARAKAQADREAADFDETMDQFFRQKNEREAERLANAMKDSIGSGIVSGEIGGRAGLESRVEQAMSIAGVDVDKIDELTEMIATKLAEEANTRIEDRALDKGIGYEDARQQLVKEDAERKEREANKGMPKAEVMSNDTYLKKLLVASVSKPKEEQIAENQLAEAKIGNKWLAEIRKAIAENEQRNRGATFAAGRS